MITVTFRTFDSVLADGARAMIRPVLWFQGTAGSEQTLCFHPGDAGEHLTTLLNYLTRRGVSASVRY